MPATFVSSLRSLVLVSIVCGAAAIARADAPARATRVVMERGELTHLGHDLVVQELVRAGGRYRVVRVTIARALQERDGRLSWQTVIHAEQARVPAVRLDRAIARAALLLSSRASESERREWRGLLAQSITTDAYPHLDVQIDSPGSVVRGELTGERDSADGVAPTSLRASARAIDRALVRARFVGVPIEGDVLRLLDERASASRADDEDWSADALAEAARSARSSS